METSILLWIGSLWTIAVGNIWLLFQMVQRRRWQLDESLLCASIYTLVCAFRSFLPRIDAERMCFFDLRLSYPFVGRSLATIAEICFAYQISRFWHDRMNEMMMMERKKKQEQNTLLAWIVRDLAFYACVFAQVWCWGAVLTRNQYFHAVEESHWCFAASILTIATIWLSGGWHRLQLDLKIACLASTAYAVFMLWIDIPLYLRKHQEIQTRVPIIPVSQGLFDSFSCSIVSQRYEDWRDEMAWLTGYFSLAVWTSLYIASGGRKNKIE
jgi:hypothetical protein